MNRHFFLMAVIALFAFNSLEAKQKQTWGDQAYKYEVRAGWATVLDLQGLPADLGVAWSGSALDMMYKEEVGSVFTTGGISAEFGLNFREWFTLSFQVSGSGVWNEVFDNLSRDSYRRSGALISVMPVARLSWVRKRTFKMYSSAGVGPAVMTYGGKTYAGLSYSIVPVGIQFGDRVYGIAECVTGKNANAQGVKVGIGFKF